jgi:hypothetical protein
VAQIFQENEADFKSKGWVGFGAIMNVVKAANKFADPKFIKEAVERSLETYVGPKIVESKEVFETSILSI